MRKLTPKQIKEVPSKLPDFVESEVYGKDSLIKKDGKLRVIKPNITFPYSSPSFVEEDWDTVGGSVEELSVESLYTSLGATPIFDLDAADIFKRTADEDVVDLSFTNGQEGELYKVRIDVPAGMNFDFNYNKDQIFTQNDIPLILDYHPDFDVINEYQVEVGTKGAYYVTPIYSKLVDKTYYVDWVVQGNATVSRKGSVSLGDQGSVAAPLAINGNNAIKIQLESLDDSSSILIALADPSTNEIPSINITNSSGSYGYLILNEAQEVVSQGQYSLDNTIKLEIEDGDLKLSVGDMNPQVFSNVVLPASLSVLTMGASSIKTASYSSNENLVLNEAL